MCDQWQHSFGLENKREQRSSLRGKQTEQNTSIIGTIRTFVEGETNQVASTNVYVFDTDSNSTIRLSISSVSGLLPNSHLCCVTSGRGYSLPYQMIFFHLSWSVGNSHDMLSLRVPNVQRTGWTTICVIVLSPLVSRSNSQRPSCLMQLSRVWVTIPFRAGLDWLDFLRGPSPTLLCDNLSDTIPGTIVSGQRHPFASVNYSHSKRLLQNPQRDVNRVLSVPDLSSRYPARTSSGSDS